VVARIFHALPKPALPAGLAWRDGERMIIPVHSGV
jgi:hypothetical protein